MEKLPLKENSCYISSNLLDEMDFVIGGYGKATPTFIYTLNTFLEAFILGEQFYLSQQEMMHMQVLSKSLFPSGRPILQILSDSGSLAGISGLGNNIGTVVSIFPTDIEGVLSYQDMLRQFIDNGMETSPARTKYLKISDLNANIGRLKYLNVGRVQDGLVATESQHAPHLFYADMQKSTDGNNLQAALPLYSLSPFVNEVKRRGISQAIFQNLTKLFLANADKVSSYIGFKYQTIPPLVNILLSQCNGVADIPSKMVQLRFDFSELRQAISRHERRINTGLSLKDQVDAINEFNSFWDVFNKKYAQDRRLLYQFWEVVKDGGYEDAVDKSIKSEDISKVFDEINFGKIIGKSVKKAAEWYKERKILNRFNGVTDLWHRFEKSPGLAEQLKEFERVFGVSFDESALRNMNDYLTRNKIYGHS